MNAKMTQDPQEDMRLKIVEAALALAAAQGWEFTSLRDIAQKSGISIADLRAHVDDKGDILVMLGRIIDRRVLENIGQDDGDEDGSVRDRLFDIMMERFDVLNDYRDGVVAVLESFRYDPKQAVISLPHLCKSMAWMMEAAGVDTNGMKGALKLAGMSVIYLKVLRAWKDDESVDMPKTMAALDKALGRAESWAENLGL